MLPSTSYHLQLMFQEPAAYPSIARQHTWCHPKSIPGNWSQHFLPFRFLSSQLHENHLADIACMNVQKGFIHWHNPSSMIVPKPSPRKTLACNQVQAEGMGGFLRQLVHLQHLKAPGALLHGPTSCSFSLKGHHAIEGLLDHAFLNAGFPSVAARLQHGTRAMLVRASVSD
ncbi:unnamed protein product [Effrenium voratum]|uniref:Uncharacterized protein n=1 Tax=Effrenium voratum TaxID=2562239 RepID=A0AA36JH64_9DINO|nr:unnamed protein product [Effrenium voratum]CAJ1416200.1 unnamed protein product [Effrenium voratum]